MKRRPFLLSVYDYSGNWARPYVRAGWKVLLWDKEHEGCILERFTTIQMIIEEEAGGRIDGLLAAPPCTAFASSGARWWPNKDRQGSCHEPWGSFTDYMAGLSMIVLELVHRFQPRFWALENPVGRIEKLVPGLKSHRKLSFDPCDFGDPYTKKTILWGDFNPNLPRHPVNPRKGSKMHSLPQSARRARLRSETPHGFAQAFFMANH